MTSDLDDPVWIAEWTRREHLSVKRQLGSIFGHEAAQSETLLDRWLERYPQWNVEAISHNGAFDTALRIHYWGILGRDPTKLEYLDWRQQFHELAKRRPDPELTPLQREILRSRGLDV